MHHCCACCVLCAMVTMWCCHCHLHWPAHICQTPCWFGGLVGSDNARSSCAATSPYPALSSLSMASLLSSMLAGADMPIALPLWTALFVRGLPVIELVVTLIVLAYLPLLRSRHRQHCAGIFTLHVLASLPQPRWLLPHCNTACDTLSLQSWRLCQRCAGVFARIALAPLPALCWCCCPCCAGVTASIVLTSLPSTCWCHCLCRAGVIALVVLASAHWQCCSRHIVIAELASLPVLCWHPCKHRAGIVTIVALALSPLLRWRLYPCAGATASILLASLPLHWHHSPCCTGICLIVMLQHVVVTELESFLVLRWHPREHRTGIIAGICWHHCQHRAGIFALVALAASP